MQSDSPARAVPEALTQTVIAGGYCVGCGACSLTPHSPFAMTMTTDGWYLPIKTEPIDEPSDTTKVCPFFNPDENEDTLAPKSFREGAQHHPDIGWHRMLFAGYAIDEDFRASGSSGGLTNWLAAELLKTGKVDGIIHVKNAPTNNRDGILFQYAISATVNDLKEGAKSKYYPIEMSLAMNLVRENPGRYVFIGVPCFVKAVRLLALTDETIRNSIKYCIALFCGHLKSRSFAEYAAWQLGIAPQDLHSFDFRTKLDDKPANRYGVTATGLHKGALTTKTCPTGELRGSDWGEGFFKLRACDYCDDIVGETADVSMGDAWLPRYVNDSRGTNLVIVRNQELVELFHSAIAEGRIHHEPTTIDEVHLSQGSNFRHRRDALNYRLEQAESAGLWHPSKRTAILTANLSSPRKKIIDLRSQLSETSHEFFATARKAGRIDLFTELIEPFQNAYHEAIQFERESQRLPETKNIAPIKSQKQSDLFTFSNPFTNLKIRAAWALRRLHDPLKKALLLPPTTPGSIGDDAMVTATVEYLRQHGFEEIALLQHAASSNLSFSVRFDAIIDLSDYFATPPRLTAAETLYPLSSYDYFFALGADILDGYYSDQRSYLHLNLCVKAEQLGFTPTLLGFSYNEAPKRLALNGMKQLGPKTRICVRDPISRVRLDSLIEHPTIPVADVAFLLQPKRTTDHILLSWLEACHRNNAFVIGINAVFSTKFFADKRPESQRAYISFYIDLIKQLSDRHPNYHYLLIPHDYRANGIGEGPILEYLYHQLPPEIQACTYLLRERYSAAEIKWITGELDFVISSRMHLAIAAIGQSTPVFCFEYQGKFRGLYDLIEQPDMVASLDEILLHPEKLTEWILQCIERSAALRAHLKSIVIKIIALAERNFAIPSLQNGDC